MQQLKHKVSSREEAAAAAVAAHAASVHTASRATLRCCFAVDRREQSKLQSQLMLQHQVFLLADAPPPHAERCVLRAVCCMRTCCCRAPPSPQSLHVGMKLLGCVLEVSDEQLSVSLPHGLRATVPAAEVGADVWLKAGCFIGVCVVCVWGGGISSSCLSACSTCLGHLCSSRGVCVCADAGVGADVRWLEAVRSSRSITRQQSLVWLAG